MKKVRLSKTWTTLAILAVCVPSLIVVTRTRAVRATTTVTVTTTSDSGAGSLRQAIADAGSGDTINFNLPAQSKIVLTSGELVLSNSITITGPGANLLTVSGNNSSRVFSTASSTTVTISGMTLADGNGAGAAFSGSGGAILCGGSLTVGDSVLANNSCAVGGGSYVGPDGRLTLTRCTLWGNKSTGGEAGAALDAEGSGSGITMSNCTVSGNTGLYAISQVGPTALSNCTVAGNHVSIGIKKIATPTLTLNNCIVAGNGTDIEYGFNVGGNNNLIQNPGSANLTGTGNITGQDPLLGPLAMNGGPTPTMELGCNSPALNAGSNSGAGSLMTDQRGAPRLAGGTVDIGAVEMQNQVTNTNDSGAGSLRDVITSATSGEIIDISPCVIGTITLTSGEIVVGNNVTINGPGANVLTVSGNNASRVFNIESGASNEINGLTITKGNGSGSNSGFGGAIFVDNNAGFTMNACVISNSSATKDGGGIFANLMSSLTMVGCTISGNGTDGVGGGVELNLNASLQITNCTLSGNNAPTAGGLYSNVGLLIMSNCTISGNSSFAGNSGGVLVNKGSETIDNCIIANNGSGGDLGSVLGATGNNNLIGVVVEGSFTGSNNIMGVDPKLGPLQNNGGPTPTMALLAGSPAIDAGSNLYSPVSDQRGFARPVDGDGDGNAVPDMGAYEAASCTVTTLTVSAQPMDQSVCPGGPATFMASPSGGGAGIATQWQISTDGGKTFADINAATSGTYSVTGVTAAQNGTQYRAVFSNHCGSATSNPATLTVNLPASVMSNPINQTACSGANATFMAAGIGSPTPTVQWQVSTGGPFMNISGATSPTLTLNSVTTAQNGAMYQAVFTNSCAVVTSSPATLTVNTAPAITASPANQTICAGGSVSFTAAATGTPTPTVQWQVSSGGSFINISGATSSTLAVNSVTAAQNGNRYQAVFTNGCNTATSSPATLTVNTAPVVTINPASQSVAASSVTFTAAASGSPTPTVQWQVSTNGGSTFTNIPGATSTTLTLSPTASQSGNRYRAVFTDTCGTATTTAATLTFYDTCIQDNTSKNTLQLNTTTGEYRFIRCSDGYTIIGKGKLSNQSGIVNLTDRQPGWVVSAGFNAGQRTGTASIQIIVAPGVSQTVRITDTNPANTCGCS